MKELSIWQEVMMEKYPEKTMTLNNFFEELGYNDLPLYYICDHNRQNLTKFSKNSFFSFFKVFQNFSKNF